MSDEPIPDVCFIDDVCRALKLSRRVLERLRQHGAFPIPELPVLDMHPRWSGKLVRQFRDGEWGRWPHTRQSRRGAA